MSVPWRSPSAVSIVVVAGVGIAGAVLLRRWGDPPAHAPSGAAAKSPSRSSSRAAAQQPNASIPKLCGLPISDLPRDVQTDPSASDYDPVRLRQLGAQIDELFQREPRQEKWAAGMELGVGDQLLKDMRTMIPDLQDPRIECRSRSCLVSWKSVDGEHDKRTAAALNLTGAAPLRHTGKPAADGRNGVYMLYRPADHFPVDQPQLVKLYDVSDPQKFKASYLGFSRQRLARIREGKNKMPSDLVGATLPE